MPNVVVVGAGAAGLAAGRCLEERGAADVAVIEAEASVGGKCLTATVSGRPFDLGAIIMNAGYKQTRKLAAEFQCELQDMPAVAVANPATGEMWAVGERLPGSRGEVASALGRYYVERLVHIAKNGRGLIAANDDVAMSFAEWLRARDLGVLESIIAPYFTSFGYGYLDEIAALYPLTFFDSSKVRMLAQFAIGARPPRWRFLQGFQSLWKSVAAELSTVETSCAVRSVERGEQGVIVNTSVRRFEADALFVSCSPAAALRFLDYSPEEERLLSSFIYQDYLVCVADVEGLAPRSCFFDANLESAKRGHLMVATRPWPELDATILYSMISPGRGVSETIDTIRQDLARIGATMGRVHLRKRWGQYFPHLPGEAIARSLPRDIEGLQGRSRTYWIGEALAFGAVEPILAHSRRVVASAAIGPAKQEAAGVR